MIPARGCGPWTLPRSWGAIKKPGTIVGAVLLVAASANAQNYRGRVQGTAFDSSQAALPGVAVTLVNDATGVRAAFTADVQGHYILPSRRRSRSPQTASTPRTATAWAG